MKIDGIVAAVIGMGVAMAEIEEDGLSDFLANAVMVS